MLKNKAVFGVLWSLCENLLRKGTSILTTLLLAFFLTPEDYGLVALLAVFLTFGTILVDSGFKQALIQKKELEASDLSTVFYVNMLAGLVVYLLIYTFSNDIASFYDDERLINLVKVSAIIVIINSFQVVPQAILSRNLNFKTLMKINVPASIISGLVAIVLAYIGLGYWALVFQMIVSATYISASLFFKTKWWPNNSFSFTSLYKLYNYGYKMFLSSILELLYKSLLIALIAKLFTLSIVGLYYFADRIKELFIGLFIVSIQSVLFPAMSSIQGDEERSISAYRNVMKILSFVVFPSLILFSVFATSIFTVFLPSKWAEAVPFLQLMCLSALVIPLTSINLNIIKVNGRSDYYLKLEFLKKVTALLAILFTYSHGVEGVLVGLLVSQYLNYLPAVFVANKLLDYPLKVQLKDFGPSLILALTIALPIYLSQSFFVIDSFFSLFSMSTTSCVAYLLLAKIFRFKSLDVVFSTINGIRK